MCEIFREKPKGYIIGLVIGEVFTKTKDGYRRTSDGKLLTEQEYETYLCSTAQKIIRIPAWQK